MWFIPLTLRGRRLAAAAGVAVALALGMQSSTRAANSWSVAAPMATGRQAPVAVLLGNGDVLVVGDRGAGELGKTAEVYRPSADAWTTVAPMSTGRAEHVGAVLPNGNALIAGGGTGGGLNPMATAAIFDAATQTWSAAASMQRARAGATATVLNSGKILVVGGMNASGAEVYDPATNTWADTGQTVIATYRAYHAAVRL